MTASQNENPTAPRSQNQEAPTHGLWSPAPSQPEAATPAPCSRPQLWSPTQGGQEAVSEAPRTLEDQLAEAMNDNMFAVKTDRTEAQDVVRGQKIVEVVSESPRTLEAQLAEAMNDNMFAVKTDCTEAQDVVCGQKTLDAHAARQLPLGTDLPAVMASTWTLDDLDDDDLDEEYFAAPVKRVGCRCGPDHPKCQSKTRTSETRQLPLETDLPAVTASTWTLDDLDDDDLDEEYFEAPVKRAGCRCGPDHPKCQKKSSP
ncbi:hypothetical protein BP6252_00613 [Coleophoma cylindrospora]|uniref:Uncharacterized protein n=1 Tax=Coleophoma cylindrospora TaxID=1849047 RepID=A0A3D8SQX5_9HELO|nr:hypothetical protein BP6252_00613 [Coleophoma cylindrospora]